MPVVLPISCPLSEAESSPASPRPFPAPACPRPFDPSPICIMAHRSIARGQAVRALWVNCVTPACIQAGSASLPRCPYRLNTTISIITGGPHVLLCSTPPCDDDDVAVCVSNDALVVALVVTRAFFFEADADAGMFARIGCSTYQLPVELAGTNRSRKRTRGGTHRGLQISPRV